jgi:predicted AAA+ superfamily ATPase
LQRPGRFLLTGSTRYGALPEAAQALTGRLHLVTVRPFSRKLCGSSNGGSGQRRNVTTIDTGPC